MSDILERMRSWRVGELDGLDELIVGDLQDGAGEIERLRGLLRDILPEIDYANPELDASDRIITLRLRERVREALGE